MTNRGRMLTTAQVAERLGVSPRTVGRYIQDGQLRAIETRGGHNRIAEADLEEFMMNRSGSRPEGPVTVVIANQKGGVGKTTLAANLGVLLWQLGQRVLLVDLDPQGHLTFTLGHNPDALTHTIYSAMLDDQDQRVAEVILPTPFGVDLAPINTDAAEADTELSRKPLWGACLKNALMAVQSHYDYIIIDSGPNLSKLTVNAFMASDYVIIPTQLEMLSVRGLQQLLRSIEQARRDANRRLQIAGTVATMAQAINADTAMAGALQQALGPRSVRVFSTIIPRSAIFKDVANARTVLAYSNPRNRYTEYYRRLLAEILEVIGGRAAGHSAALTTGTPVAVVKEAAHA